MSTSAQTEEVTGQQGTLATV
ncbi:MAG: hypothetical protein QOK11_2409, partial [Pseudonocardiales bacterium]|nr:hypothetical protein [Pseudonocardiales bacterium]